MTSGPFNICPQTDAPLTAAERELYSTHLPAWAGGMEGTPRPVTPATDPGILSLLLAVLVLIGLNMHHVRRIFKSLPQDLLSVRRRNNIFDEHTSNEKRVIALLLTAMSVTEGLLLFIWLGNTGPGLTSAAVFRTVAWLTALAAGYYLFQLCACALVGFVFTDKTSAGLWMRGLNASQSILGIALAAPTLVALFYPSLAGKMLVLAGVLYLLSRICYIFKGFRIFYHKIPSLIYFILYLCTLEIIPFISLCLMASDICVKVQ